MPKRVVPIALFWKSSLMLRTKNGQGITTAVCPGAEGLPQRHPRLLLDCRQCHP